MPVRLIQHQMPIGFNRPDFAGGFFMAGVTLGPVGTPLPRTRFAASAADKNKTPRPLRSARDRGVFYGRSAPRNSRHAIDLPRFPISESRFFGIL
jgi:hypothetical protein